MLSSRPVVLCVLSVLAAFYFSFIGIGVASGQASNIDINQSVSVSIDDSGNGRTYQFAGAPGQQVNVQVTNSSFGGCFSLTLTVLNPDGSQLATNSMCGTGSIGLSALSLSQSGTYTIELLPGNPVAGTANLTLSTDQNGGQLSNGNTQGIEIDLPGQREVFTFAGAPGQQANVIANNSTFTGCFSLTLIVLNPDGSQAASNVMCGTGSLSISGLTLTQTGTYQVIFQPDGGATGTANLTYSANPAPIPVSIGSSTPVSVSVPGTDASLAFSGSASQVVNVQVTNSNFTGCFSLTLSVLKPDGSTLASTPMCGTGSLGLSSLILPTTGTYTIVLLPGSGGTGSALVTVSTNQTAQISSGVPAQSTITLPGQNELFTFSATGGQQGSVSVQNSTFNGCISLTVSVVNPDGSTLASVPMCGTGGLSLSGLTFGQTGNYTIVFAPGGGATGTATVNLDIVQNTATPTFSPVAGTYSAPQAVSILDATSAATIYYTLDGTTPTTASSLYSGPITVSSSETLNAIAVATNYNNSAVASGSYVIHPVPVITTLAPSHALPGGVVRVQGQYFGSTQGSGSLALGGNSITPISWTDAAITFVVPTGASTGTLMITDNSGDSTSATLTILSLAGAYSRQVTVDHTKVPNTDQTSFPVLVAGQYPFLANAVSGGRLQSSSGYDIAFTADAAGQQPLDYEIDTYSGTNGQVAYWIRIPTLSHTIDTVFYLWYGIPGATDSLENVPGVWSNGYAAVYHLGDSSLPYLKDSSTDSSFASATGITELGGMIGGAASFNNNSAASYIDLGSSTLLKPTSMFTLEAWANPSSVAAWSSIVSLDYAASGSWAAPYTAYSLGVQSSPNMAAAQVSISGSQTTSLESGTLPLNTWSHVVGVFDGNELETFVNGAELSSVAASGAIDYGSSRNLVVGTDSPYLQPMQGGWTGLLDEVRVSAVARKSDWIATEFANQQSPSTFYIFGAETFEGATTVPQIISISPAPVYQGGRLHIRGANFGSSIGTSVVALNGVALTPLVWDDTYIQLFIPSTAISGWLTVTVNGATSLPVAVTVAPTAAPTLSWPTPLPIGLGTALTSLQLNATSSVSGTFVYDPPVGTLLPIGTSQLSTTFYPTDQLKYSPVSATVSITVGPTIPLQLPATGLISTIAGNGISGYIGDGGQAVNAELQLPASVAVDNSGNVYIADSHNNAIRKVSAQTGVITTIVGNGAPGYSGDNGPAAAATLQNPLGVSVDAAGNLYIADTGNNAIREVIASTNIITTIVGDGSGNLGYSGDGGLATAALLGAPSSVTVDGSGNIYIADSQNNVVRKVTRSSGLIGTVVGDGTGIAGYQGDGGAASLSRLNAPLSISLDTSGNLYIADSGNNIIREVAGGVINTIAGTGNPGYSGDGASASQAQLNRPTGIVVDQNANLYIADSGNSTIRRISASTGQISTIAGIGSPSYFGDLGTATTAALNNPMGVSVDAIGNVYIGDTNNSVVRAIGGSSSNPITTPSPNALLVVGAEQSQISNGTTIYDNGIVTVNVYPNGLQAAPFSITASWGQNDTPSSIAINIAQRLSSGSSPVTAQVVSTSNGPVINLNQAGSAAPSLYPVTISQASNPQFAAASFITSLLGGNNTSTGAGGEASGCGGGGAAPPALAANQGKSWSVPNFADTTYQNVNYNQNGGACVIEPITPEDIAEGNYQKCEPSGRWQSGTYAVASLDQGESVGNAWWGVTWTGFSAPTIPPGATVNGVYAVETAAATGNGAIEVMGLDSTPLGRNFVASTTPINGSCYSSNLIPAGVTADNIPAQQLTSFVYQTLNNTLSESVGSPFVGFEVVYTMPSPTTSPQTSLVLLDPYVPPLLPSKSSNQIINYTTVVNARNTANAIAKGLIADGTSTAIALFSTNIQQDVTFSVDATLGITIAPWSSNFLSSAPVTTSTPTQLIVPASSLIQIGSTYYALALIQAPLSTTSLASLNKSILCVYQGPSCSSSPATTSQSTVVQLYPRPVILVHGLWGDASSLDPIANYLKASDTYFTGEVMSACYSDYIAFNEIPGQDVVHSFNSCETTSAQGIDNALSQIYATLDAPGTQIVGGRVDLVAHSMGGLATRNYMSSVAARNNMPMAGFLDIRSRKQGEFADVITIDSPESGSPLATFLVDNANDTVQTINARWTAFCGTAIMNNNANPTQIPLSDCFAELGEPVEVPGTVPSSFSSSPEVGYLSAVASIQPDSPNISSLPTNIPCYTTITALCTQWLAISASWPIQAPTQSFLRYFLNGVVDAETGSSIQLSDIMGTTGHPSSWQDDVIVPVVSQWGSPAVLGTEFLGLAHTGISPLIDAFFFENPEVGYSLANVIEDERVSQLILCTLTATVSQSISTTSSPCASSITTIPAPESAFAPEGKRDAATSQNPSITQPNQFEKMFPATDRVKVIVPTSPLKFLEDNKLQLDINQPGLSTLVIEQTGIISSGAHEHINDGVNVIPVVRGLDGKYYINIVPKWLGKLKLGILGKFPDGGMVAMGITVNVGPSQARPAEIIVGEKGIPFSDVHIIRLYMDEPDGGDGLTLAAKYSGFAKWLLISPSYAQFSVKPNVASSIVGLDQETGILKPLSEGHILLETQFGGLTHYSCVVVESKRGQDAHDPTRCEDLLPQNQSLGPAR